MHDTIKLYCITKLIPGKEVNQQIRVEEFVTATHINQVIEYCKLDLSDEATEVIGIEYKVPVIASLPRETR